jgi:hypothetical protein
MRILTIILTSLFLISFKPKDEVYIRFPNEIGVVETCVGQVVINGENLKNGFSLNTDNTKYFGTLNDGKVIELCVSQWNDKTTNEILKISNEFNLLFVDWFNCDLIKND